VQEEAELDTLIAEGQQATLRKAKALLALKYLGIDIVSGLGLGCLKWLLAVDRFLDSRCQSRLSSA
jgi:hypothetical protein